MNKTELLKVVKNHENYVQVYDKQDVVNMCQFVEDLLLAERRIIRENEPQAFNTIHELGIAIELVSALGFGIEDDDELDLYEDDELEDEDEE